MKMKYIIPPACEPTVPLLGPYQIAGYAKSVGYEMQIYNFNNYFLKTLVDNVECDESIKFESALDCLEYKIYQKFLLSYNIKNYGQLLEVLRTCKTTNDYWSLIDYVRCCYDLYSFKYNDLRFRFDGVDSKYKWNIWSDIDKFIEEYYDSDFSIKMKDWIKQIDIESKEIVGINITFESQLFFAIILCKIITENYPKTKIVVGGGFVNSFINSDDSIGPISKYCDLVVSGEGEALIWYLLKNDNCINGIKSYISSDSRAKFVKASELCNEKISVCPPQIEREELDKYFSPLRVLPLRFTYQCYWGKCKFCTDKEYHSCLDSKYNIQEMIDFSVKSAKNNSIHCIYFLDSAIPVSVMKKFCRALIDNNVKIRWGTNSRFDLPFTDETFIKLLSDAGCVFIKFGLESGSQHVLDLMDKGIKIESAASAIKLCRKYNILTHTYIMFAFPGETDVDREKTMKFILDDDTHPDNYNCSEFIMYGNSAISEDFNYDLENAKNKDGWYNASYSFTNEHIKEQIQFLRKCFDKKFSPSDILISTGHTIALANKLRKNNQIISLYNDSRVKIHKEVVVDEKNELIGRWRRRDGIVYLCGKDAQKILEFKNTIISIQDLLKLDFNTKTIYSLVDAGFLELEHIKKDKKLESYGENTINFSYGNKFLFTKWYGYYDNN